ncbi:hypothetical protein [Desulfovibrio cuneatus]|uniref:hypothetical protein n=1 Tax=Desulfovibrio cuneatus TaxID=159728 RepID=UPI0003FDCB0F|nr:hypothetical protein [Desulfovibrio cuneatus]
MPFTKLQEICRDISLPVFISLFGGSVYLLYRRITAPAQIAINLVLSVFIGVSVFWGLEYFHFPDGLNAAIVSFASAAGYPVFDAIQKRMVRTINTFPGPGAAPPQPGGMDEHGNWTNHKPGGGGGM